MKTFADAVNSMKKTIVAAEQAIRGDFFKAILGGTPVDTGEARGGWVISLDTPNTSYTRRLDPTGASVAAQIDGVVGSSFGTMTYLSNMADYIVALEYGKSGQAPQGMVRINIAAFQHIAAQAVSRVI